MKVTVLGDGAWGTAIAWLLAHNDHSVTLWCNESKVEQAINTNHMNDQYLPGLHLPLTIWATTDLKKALENQLVFEAIPVKFLRSVLLKAKSGADDNKIWVVLSKGMEVNSLLLPSQIVEDVLGIATNTVVISGPSFAHDVVKKQITSVSIASKNPDALSAVQQIVDNDFFRTIPSSDPMGVHVGGALKNVVALGIGMLEGAGYTDNAQAFFLTKGLQEIAEIAAILGGKRETVYGLSGLGDLVLTAMGNHSKNRAFGQRLGKVESLSFLSLQGALPEGCNTVQSVKQLIERYAINAPLCAGLYEVVFNEKSLEQYMQSLLQS